MPGFNVVVPVGILAKTEAIEWIEPPAKPILVIDPSKPFTHAEDDIMSLILKAQVMFVALPGQNKYAVNDFLRATRDIRRIIAMRTVKRNFPDYEVEES